MKSRIFRRFALLFGLSLAFVLAAAAPAQPKARPGLREGLVREQASFAFSRRLPLSGEERKAEAVLAGLRADFRRSFAANPNLPFARPFYSWREELKGDPLRRLLDGMPKGGLLHVHASAAGDVEWLVDRALATPDCCARWPEPGQKFQKGELAFFAAGQVPAGWVPLSELQRTVPGFRQELVRLYTLGPEDADGDVWQEFEAIFQRIDAFLSYRPVFLDYSRHTLELLAADGVQFAEFRTSLDGITAEDGRVLDCGEVLALYRSVLADVRAAHPEFDLKIIVCSYRGRPAERVKAKLEQTAALRAAHPDLVIGFDIVGEEDRGHPNRYYAEALRSVPGVPLYLHGGESLFPDNDNALDAVLLGTRRIGHGFNLVHWGNVERLVREAGIPLEVCPVSNQLLGYVRDLRLHPARGFLARGGACVLASDDPALFRSELSDDFWEAYVSWGLDLRSLKKLALNSIDCSGLTPAEKAKHRKLFAERWAAFIRAVNASVPHP